MALQSFATPESVLLARLVKVTREHCAPPSPFLHQRPCRQEMVPNGVKASFGLDPRSAKRLAARCRPSIVDASDRCLLPKLSTTSTRTRWFPVQSLRLTPEAEATGFGTCRVARGGGVITSTLESPLRQVARPLGLVGTFGAYCSPSCPCDQPLTSVSLLSLPVFVGRPPSRDPPGVRDAKAAFPNIRVTSVGFDGPRRLRSTGAISHRPGLRPA